jgi:preprotein translocase subunit YajC
MNMTPLYADQTAQQPGVLASLMPLLIMFAIFYFLVILPQKKQAKQHKEMVDALKKGDKIVTAGGIIAEVIKNEDDFIKAKIGNNVEVKITKDAVARKLDEGQE